MLEACGIVAEYNPFHNGHLRHLHESVRLSGLPVIAVMSGSMLQRGEPAWLDKWTRARLAVANGVALVLELPCAFSLRSAQYFAQGAVALLQATGLVTVLSCGVEHPDWDFAGAANLTKAAAFQELVRQNMKNGLSYAAATENALQTLRPAAKAELNSPNDILALEYTKALQNTGIRPLYIKRNDGGYHNNNWQQETAYLAAGAIRAACRQKQYAAIRAAVPGDVYEVLSHSSGYNEQLLWRLLCWRLRSLSAEEIADRSTVSEGLENLLKDLRDCASLAEALASAANKRCPASRLRRLLLQLALGQARTAFEEKTPAYLRVLAFNDTGRLLLRKMRASASLPILSKLGRELWREEENAAIKRQLQLELAASDFWALLQTPQEKCAADFYHAPIYLA